MLDLGFVRGNLEHVEEKLRARGAAPAVLLGDFRVLDQSRREAITLAEQCKARRNELSQQVGALKKSGQDAAAVMEENRALKDKLDELDRAAADYDDRLRQLLADRKIVLELDAQARLWLADAGYDMVYGARPLKRVIQRSLQNPLATLLLEGRIQDGQTVVVTADENGLVIDA